MSENSGQSETIRGLRSERDDMIVAELRRLESHGRLSITQLIPIIVSILVALIVFIWGFQHSVNSLSVKIAEQYVTKTSLIQAKTDLKEYMDTKLDPMAKQIEIIYRRMDTTHKDKQ